MTKIELITERMRKVWHSIDDFIETKNDKFLYIVEVAGQSYLKINYGKNDKCFKIINTVEGDICLLPIDGKNGLFGFGDSHCDTVVFNNRLFCFIEMKHNATSLKNRAIRQNRRKAVKQLSNTIETFDDKLEKDYADLDLIAIVSTPEIYPRQDTAWESLSIEFLEKYGIPLLETRKMEFG